VSHPLRSTAALITVIVLTGLTAMASPATARPAPSTVASNATANAVGSGIFLGPDVSSWQHSGGAINWTATRASVSFAFIKATEGAGRASTSSTNPWFGKDWKAAGAAGVVRGAYHYARPRYPLSTAASDAQRFMSVVGQAGRGELAPVLDLEETGGLTPKALATWLDTWMRETSRMAGRPAMIYTTRGYWTSFISDTTKFAQYPLWMANHTTAAQPVPLPGGWKAWSFWQYNDAGRVAGISSIVDLNWSCGWPGSTPSGAKGSICTTTKTSSASSSAGATVQASKPTSSKSTAPRSAAPKSTAKKTTANKSTSSKSTATKTTASKKPTPVVPKKAPTAAPAPPPPPPPQPLPRRRDVF